MSLTDWLESRKGTESAGPNPRVMGRSEPPTLEELVAVVEAQSAQLTVQSSRIEEPQSALAAAQAQIAELESRLGSGGAPPGVSPRNAPHFVKGNRPPKPEGPPPERKKREENHARKLERPTEEVVHPLERCPKCHRPLPDGWVANRRQVLDIPVVPYIVREHLVMGHRCGVCQKTHLAPPPRGRSRRSAPATPAALRASATRLALLVPCVRLLPATGTACSVIP